MKTRNGFISNSSSGSFIINKNCLSDLQIDNIKNHATSLYFKRNSNHKYDAWNISEDEFCIYGRTSMDNFDMWEFLRVIGVDMNMVEWGD